MSLCKTYYPLKDTASGDYWKLCVDNGVLTLQPNPNDEEGALLYIYDDNDDDTVWLIEAENGVIKWSDTAPPDSVGRILVLADLTTKIQYKVIVSSGQIGITQVTPWLEPCKTYYPLKDVVTGDYWKLVVDDGTVSLQTNTASENAVLLVKDEQVAWSVEVADGMLRWRSVSNNPEPIYPVLITDVTTGDAYKFVMDSAVLGVTDVPKLACMVTPPLEVPTISAFATSGGTLPAGTYYVRVVARYGWVGHQGDYGCGGLQSPPSNEVFVTLDGTNTNAIQVDWSPVDGASGYDVYITDTSGDYFSYNNGYCRAVNGQPVWDPVTTETTYTITQVPDIYVGASVHTFATNFQDVIPCDVELGALRLRFEGVVTLHDIANAVKAAGFSDYCLYDGTNFVLKGSIWLTGNAEGYLKLNNKNITFVHGTYENDNPNIIVEFGDYNNNRASNGCVVNSIGRVIYGIGVSDKVYDTSFKWTLINPTNENRDVWGYYGSEVHIKTVNTYDLTYDNTSAVFSVDAANFCGKKDYMNAVSPYSYDDSLLLTNFEVKYGYVLLKAPNTIMRDVVISTFKYRPDYPLLSLRKAGTDTFKIYNFDFQGVADQLPKVRWRYSNTSSIESYYTVALTVTNETGTPLENAFVAVHDKDGNIVANGNTNINGEFSADVLYTVITADGDIGTSNSNYDIKTPHTITITKPGYAPVVLSVRVNKKITQILPLTKLNISTDQEVF